MGTYSKVFEKSNNYSANLNRGSSSHLLGDGNLLKQ